MKESITAAYYVKLKTDLWQHGMHETLGNKPILECLSNKDKHPSKGDAIK